MRVNSFSRLIGIWLVGTVAIMASPGRISPVFGATARQQSPVLWTEPTAVSPGAMIAIHWDGFNGTGNDWISFHPINTGHDSYLNWQWAKTTSGALTFETPYSTGWYEFRLFRNGDHVATSNPFEVAWNAVVVDDDVTPAPIPGGVIEVPTNPTGWHILVLVYGQTDFSYVDSGGQQRHVVAAMTPEERSRAEIVARAFFEQDVPALTSGHMVPVVTVRYPTRALSQLSAFCSHYPDPYNTALESDPAFDSVVVIWDDTGADLNTGEFVDLHQCGGAAQPMGTGPTYLAIPIDSVTYVHRNVFKHEWGHSILYYFEAAGAAPNPPVNNHINDTDTRYVNCLTGEPYILLDETLANPIVNSIYNNDVGFTHDYYSGLTALAVNPTACLGITPAAWAAGGPVH